MKVYYCRDAGFDCKVEIRGENKDEILRLAGLHSHEVHGLKPTGQIKQDMRRLIREEKPQSDEYKMNR
ncbi:DUF1059 domain-containing protein [Salegentibacter sediminis]|uniref:DUF1059 domain-containing protein n=1 Tax=Salegentibacter sediminis TaxID=1930251 RepID=UPI0009C15A12|nr:DUF1059 domain-containing protein [Salegentibacter sediminis]